MLNNKSIFGLKHGLFKIYDLNNHLRWKVLNTNLILLTVDTSSNSAPYVIILSYSHQKYYCYHQTTKQLYWHPIFNFSNIAIAILDFSLLLIVKLSILILFASFVISVLCFFFNSSLSKVITLPTIAIAIVVALSLS